MHSRSGWPQRLRESVRAARDCGAGLGSGVREAAVDSGAQGRVSDIVRLRAGLCAGGGSGLLGLG